MRTEAQSQPTSSARQMPSTVLLPDALREALGHVLANERREWRRERELIEAQSREALSELKLRVLDLERGVTESISARLSQLKDGRDGLDGERGLDGGPGRDGRDGLDGKNGEPGQDGKDGSAGKDGAPGERGLDGQAGRDGIDGKDGRDGLDGKDGERGLEGPPGKLPVVRAWSDGVHYEGDVVSHGGALYQARRDTGRAPPHEDWHCIAAAGADGRDGRSFVIRGTWDEAAEYSAFDVVVFKSASFVARRDKPGVCPGEGWQLLAGQGKQGKPGEPGERGPAGRDGMSGPSGPPLIAAEIDDEGLLTLTNGDGSTVTCDLYPLLAKIAR